MSEKKGVCVEGSLADVPADDSGSESEEEVEVFAHSTAVIEESAVEKGDDLVDLEIGDDFAEVASSKEKDEEEDQGIVDDTFGIRYKPQKKKQYRTPSGPAFEDEAEFARELAASKQEAQKTSVACDDDEFDIDVEPSASSSADIQAAISRAAQRLEGDKETVLQEISKEISALRAETNPQDAATSSSASAEEPEKHDIRTASAQALHEITSVYSSGLGDQEVRLLFPKETSGPTDRSPSVAHESAAQVGLVMTIEEGDEDEEEEAERQEAQEEAAAQAAAAAAAKQWQQLETVDHGAAEGIEDFGISETSTAASSSASASAHVSLPSAPLASTSSTSAVAAAGASEQQLEQEQEQEEDRSPLTSYDSMLMFFEQSDLDVHRGAISTSTSASTSSTSSSGLGGFSFGSLLGGVTSPVKLSTEISTAAAEFPFLVAQVDYDPAVPQHFDSLRTIFKVTLTCVIMLLIVMRFTDGSMNEWMDGCSC